MHSPSLLGRHRLDFILHDKFYLLFLRFLFCCISLVQYYNEKVCDTFCKALTLEQLRSFIASLLLETIISNFTTIFCTVFFFNPVILSVLSAKVTGPSSQSCIP